MTTDHVPAADRLAYFREVLTKNDIPTVGYGDRGADFSARMDGGGLGNLNLVSLTSRSLWSRRGLRRDHNLIRRSDGSHYQLVLYLQSLTMLDHNERQVELSPGDMTLIDTSRPYNAFHESGRSRILTVHIPRTLLPVSSAAADKLVGARLCGRAGMGALLRGYVLRTAKDLNEFGAADPARSAWRCGFPRTRAGRWTHGGLQAASALPTDPRLHPATTRRSEPDTGDDRRSASHLCPYLAPAFWIPRSQRRRVDPYPAFGPVST
jgi:AraC-binding-like domain